MFLGKGNHLGKCNTKKNWCNNVKEFVQRSRTHWKVIEGRVHRNY
jgi:hypothetical protein